MLKVISYVLGILWMCCISVTAKYFTQYLSYEKPLEAIIVAFYGQLFVLCAFAVALYFSKKDTFSKSSIGRMKMLAKLTISVCNVGVILFFSHILTTQSVTKDGLIFIPLFIILLAANTMFLHGDKSSSLFDCWPLIIIKRKTLEERKKLEELKKT